VVCSWKAVRAFGASTLAFAAAFIAVLVLAIGPAYGTIVADKILQFSIPGGGDFCALAGVEQQAAGYLYTNSLTTTWHSNCTSVLNWPSGAIQARSILWQEYGNGVYYVCVASSSIVYNPAPYPAMAYQSMGSYGCDSNFHHMVIGENDAYVLVGFPPQWFHQAVFTNGIEQIG
jgi:hypothetical protein